MQLVEVLEDAVWSIKYSEDEEDILAQLLDRWQDAEYIHGFMYDHENLIETNPYWENCSFQEVMLSTINEAKNLESYLIQLYRNSEKGITPNLEEKFVQLDKEILPGEVITRRKMYGKLRKTYPPSVLRLYALKLDSEGNEPPIFIITGGGIKLTEEMRQMPDLNKELDRLRSVRTWLQEKEIETKEQFYSFIKENVQ